MDHPSRDSADRPGGFRSLGDFSSRVKPCKRAGHINARTKYPENILNMSHLATLHTYQ